MLDQAQAAIQNLAKLNRSMSQSAIGLMMGTNAVGLERYPRVRASSSKPRRKMLSGAKPNSSKRLNRAIEHLRSLNQRISPRAVGALIGRSPAD